MTLDELSVKYGTDKGSLRHNYCQIYDDLFAPLRRQPINLLEVGVQYGNSMRMWRDYFWNAASRIVGLDAIDNRVPNDGFTVYLCDAYRDVVVIPEQDIIIDDGSHDPKEQVMFVDKYARFVKPGGFLIVEDILSRETVDILECHVWEAESVVRVFDCRAPGVDDGWLFIATRPESSQPEPL